MVSIIGIITTRTITIIMIVIEINFPDHQCGWLHFLVLSYLNKDHKQKKGKKRNILHWDYLYHSSCFTKIQWDLELHFKKTKSIMCSAVGVFYIGCVLFLVSNKEYICNVKSDATLVNWVGSAFGDLIFMAIFYYWLWSDRPRWIYIDYSRR